MGGGSAKWQNLVYINKFFIIKVYAVAAMGEFFDVARDREEMKVELEYRQRLHEVNSEVKKRFDYQVDLQTLEKDIEEKHIASWVEQEVLKSIADQSDEA